MKKLLLSFTLSLLVGFAAMAQTKASASKQKQATPKAAQSKKRSTDVPTLTVEEKIKNEAAAAENQRKENEKAASFVDERNK
jgi:hypothetical protein